MKRDMNTVKVGAYHEAAHVVVGMMFKHYLDSRGVEIAGVGTGNQDLSGLCCTVQDNTEENSVITLMAGRIAESKLSGKPLRHCFDKGVILYALEMMCRGYADLQGDTEGVIQAIMDEVNNKFTPEIMEKIENYQEQTIEILDRPLVWKSITAVAEQLLVVGKMSPDELDEVLQSVNQRYSGE